MILNILPSTATSSLQKARLANILPIFKAFKRAQAKKKFKKRKNKKKIKKRQKGTIKFLAHFKES